MNKLLICIALVISGCAVKPPKVWHKEGGTNEGFLRDQMQCRQYGMQSAMANGLAGNAFVEIWVDREAETCLRSLGYY